MRDCKHVQGVRGCQQQLEVVLESLADFFVDGIRVGEIEALDRGRKLSYFRMIVVEVVVK
jgi:hypothetical protein